MRWAGNARLEATGVDVYGFDSGKVVKGRKRQTIVDSLGLLLKVIVGEGNAPERVLAPYALMELVEERPELLEKVLDKNYVNNCKLFNWQLFPLFLVPFVFRLQ